MSEKRNKILIVEDSELNIAVLVDILKHDYDMFVAKDGIEAIEKAGDIMPDLILLDIVLPKMDGYEVIKLLKENPGTSEIPIIFVTALSNVDNERKGLMLGADDYIQKPYDPISVKLRVDIQIRIVNQMRTIKLLSEEIASWMKDD
ncbi:MAG: response regulator [Oscillospiraceae bacterium]|nr:response regulator [Oscillospiraceae bacterium]MCL2278900.1 response regulator [Oscillospiraceae bacterium]